MQFFTNFWTVITHVTTWFTMSPLDAPGAQQQPLLGLPDYKPVVAEPIHGAIFTPAGSLVDKPIQCNYTASPGFYDCSSPDDRECWLRHRDGREFNIHTNYENIWPNGTDRHYTLVVTDDFVNADGMIFPHGKLFNNQFPGPWIQACWGDTIHITVKNRLKYNGTSIHWHGLRMFKTMHMDGVNGITQCPIAPGDEFTYQINTTQYGSSWYHSHYSVQYADGLQGPITIYGPSSGNYDVAVYPTVMTDWGHNSAFEAVYGERVAFPSILLNGTGNINSFSGHNMNTSIIPPTYQLHVEKEIFDPKTGSPFGRAKRYLFRLINTSFDTTFIFSIDNHWLQIISADFVPIEPYYNTSVLIGIGQRYNVIVEAHPVGGPFNPLQDDGNYWMRTYTTCKTQQGDCGYEKMGILRYDNTSTSSPNSTQWHGISLACSDETYTSLKPKIPWFVGYANNTEDGEQFNVTLNPDQGSDANFPLAIFSMEPKDASGFTPLQINYDDPMFLHLDNFDKPFEKSWVVVPENYTENDWIYMVFTGSKATTYGAHPIHLHGHDFAILAQRENSPYPPKGGVKLNRCNPPRRDVVLLPNNGFVVIAFKADNPGSWLVHCHIAYHASYGLSMQILEDQIAANNIWLHNQSTAIAMANATCTRWKKWKSNCKNLWPGNVPLNGKDYYPACDDKAWIFQDDSGI